MVQIRFGTTPIRVRLGEDTSRAEIAADEAEAAAASAAADAATLAGMISTVSPRSGYIAGFWDADTDLLLLGFRITDLRPIFGNGGDIVARIDAIEGGLESTVTGRSGILGGFMFDDGSLAWHVSAFDGSFWANGRNVTAELDALAGRVETVESGSLTPEGATDLVVVGDSMIAAGSGIMDVLPALVPTRAVTAVAEGGENTAGIAVSFGVPDLLTLAVTGNALPTSSTVTCVPNIPFLNDGQSARVEVVDETGAAIVCRVSRSGATYSLRPATYPAAAKKVQNPARARVISLQASGTDPSAALPLDPLYDRTLVARLGRNAVGYSAGYDGAAETALAARIVALMRSGRYIMLGPTNGTNDVPVAQGGLNASISQANSAINLDNVIDLNSRFFAAFPGHYFSPIAKFDTVAGVSTFTVNGTAYRVVNDTVLVDGVHENATGKGHTGDLVVTALATLEY